MYLLEQHTLVHIVGLSAFPVQIVFTQVWCFDVVDGAGVGHSGEQIVEMCEVAGWDGQITLTLSLHLISVQNILHWENSFIHTQRHLQTWLWLMQIKYFKFTSRIESEFKNVAFNA